MSESPQLASRQYIFFRDPSFWLLLIINVTTIYFAVREQWSIHQLMWIYWFQSIIIGIFHFIRIISLKHFSTEGVRINDMPVEPTRATQLYIAFFFALHYGIFHFAYLLFLIFPTIEGAVIDVPRAGVASVVSMTAIAIATASFFANHLFSFLYNRAEDKQKTYNIGTLMFFPYARVFPMHFVILIGSYAVQNTNTLVLFLILRMAADLIMHGAHHGMGKNNRNYHAVFQHK